MTTTLTKTNILARAAMTLLMTLAMTLTASATDFITDVMLLGNSDQSSFNEQLNELTDQGWTDINKDLNAGCGGDSDYIHLLYKTQTSSGNTGTAITGFYIWAGDEDTHPNSLTIDGRTYNLVPYDGSGSFINSQGDLNNNAGGKYIHLYYTKDALVINTGIPGVTITFHLGVTDITFNDEQSGALGANGNNTGYDLNAGCGSGSAYIYMHVDTDTGGNVVTLSSGSGEVQLQDGHILTGTGGADTHVTIADGATVTLSGVNITAIVYDENHRWPGIGCLGDAVIVLDEGTTDTIKGGYYCSGIHVPVNKTLTIQGSGTLNATGFTGAAGIGSYQQSSCGNINISGGDIKVKGGYGAAGIGSGHQHSSCGAITISGGTVTAKGGQYAAGIGTGWDHSSCGNITINGTVTADSGYDAAGIGGGKQNSSCGNITINGGNVYAYGGAPGIGSGNDHSSCGNITISGGTVDATDGYGNATPGIGSGYNQSECGHISITQDVTRVTATRGGYCDNVIGAGVDSSCQSVTIGSMETGFIRGWSFTTFPYFVAFDANGGTGEQADAQPFMYNVAQPLWSNIFTCTGYTFDGWATTLNGPKAYDNHQTVSNLADTIATVTLYARWKASKAIAGYGTGNGGWKLIASPMANAVTPSTGNGIIQGTYDLYRFNQAAELEWENWKQTGDHYHFNLESGCGYLYANQANTTLTFNGTPYSGNGQVTLTKTANAELEGWNLMGNPFGTAKTIGSKPFYRMNDLGTEIIAATNPTIAAMEGIFVVANTNGETITFAEPTRDGESEERIVINLSPSTGSGTEGNAVIDRAIIRFGEGETLPKFQIRENSTKVYIPQNGKEYAIINAEAQTDEIPVNFKAESNGTYTLSFDGDVISSAAKKSVFTYLHLIDNLTGADIDLLTPPACGHPLLEGEVQPAPQYTFTAKTTDYESRFRLVFATENAGPSTGSGTFAFISDGNIIVNNGPSTGSGTSILQVFDVLGRRVFSKELSTVNYQLSTANFLPGVYVLRLINGENVRTQKIVMR